MLLKSRYIWCDNSCCTVLRFAVVNYLSQASDWKVHCLVCPTVPEESRLAAAREAKEANEASRLVRNGGTPISHTKHENMSVSSRLSEKTDIVQYYTANNQAATWNGGDGDGSQHTVHERDVSTDNRSKARRTRQRSDALFDVKDQKRRYTKYGTWQHGSARGVRDAQEQRRGGLQRRARGPGKMPDLQTGMKKGRSHGERKYVGHRKPSMKKDASLRTDGGSSRGTADSRGKRARAAEYQYKPNGKRVGGESRAKPDRSTAPRSKELDRWKGPVEGAQAMKRKSIGQPNQTGAASSETNRQARGSKKRARMDEPMEAAPNHELLAIDAFVAAHRKRKGAEGAASDRAGDGVTQTGGMGASSSSELEPGSEPEAEFTSGGGSEVSESEANAELEMQTLPVKDATPKCTLCGDPDNSHVEGGMEYLFVCATPSCKNAGHGACYDFSGQLVDNLYRSTAPWYCNFCKRCTKCGSMEERGMLLCECCDTGTHMACCNPPLTTPPSEFEDWICKLCREHGPGAGIGLYDNEGFRSTPTQPQPQPQPQSSHQVQAATGVSGWTGKSGRMGASLLKNRSTGDVRVSGVAVANRRVQRRTVPSGLRDMAAKLYTPQNISMAGNPHSQADTVTLSTPTAHASARGSMGETTTPIDAGRSKVVGINGQPIMPKGLTNSPFAILRPVVKQSSTTA
ncbi:hypothetical protein SARC_09158 [Sphaeroforma arctica JP610]|uniref:PHD-type domain-containing protein n=1 Tax=Sphaeroforma arctica JP610 TaxID=667725 RepID=A0A0L0FNL6_9EUKA|nr:hypothetical protein SARC_09158 [Sphaeroforma arctica JP610]KNC78412.1 hypothetical protein SARC_09158 [Sphaeroforma arctica JP610]|eukprot:XP_014152314.1 hypothetical protein SARC_09158 [Sphaeroforma arctica JP610]